MACRLAASCDLTIHLLFSPVASEQSLLSLITHNIGICHDKGGLSSRGFTEDGYVPADSLQGAKVANVTL